jgi:hypothetical protein
MKTFADFLIEDIEFNQRLHGYSHTITADRLLIMVKRSLLQVEEEKRIQEELERRAEWERIYD